MVSGNSPLSINGDMFLRLWASLEVKSAVHVPHKRHLAKCVLVDGRRVVQRRLQEVCLASGFREVVLNHHDGSDGQHSHLRH